MAAGWDGPGGEVQRQRSPLRWRTLLWALIFPRRDQHMRPTVSGVLLIALSLGIGTAAYNSSNNILFITLALLLACLILSGVLSWFNFAQMRWRLLIPPTARVGQASVVSLDLTNAKILLPTYGLEGVVLAEPVIDSGAERPETSFTAKGKDVKAIFRKHPERTEGRVRLETRLDPQESVRLDWPWTPTRRGRWTLALRDVGSYFPFSFFDKKLASRLRRELVVWPAPIDYRWEKSAGARWSGGSTPTTRAGRGSDLLALRRYAEGDSHRLIHWKASARTRQLLVRQFSSDAIESYTLRLDLEEDRWENAEQFERLVSFAATVAEDLFREGRLAAAIIGGEPARPIRQVRDLEALLDALAMLVLPLPGESSSGAKPPVAQAKRNLLTFAPDGSAGVVALIDGEKAATA